VIEHLWRELYDPGEMMGTWNDLYQVTLFSYDFYFRSSWVLPVDFFPGPGDSPLKTYSTSVFLTVPSFPSGTFTGIGHPGLSIDTSFVPY
jgi:hypothetical protein